MESAPAMKARNVKPRLAGLAPWLLALLVPQSALAIMGGSGIDANTTDSPWAGVGSITTGSGTFSGALIGDGYVLTAAHVVAGQVNTPGNVHFNLNYGGDLTQSISAAAIYVFPGYNGTTSGSNGVWHDDLAVVKLSTPAPLGVPVYGLAGSAPGQGTTITLVGYGGAGDGSSGITAGSNAKIKRVGENRVDALLVDDDGGSAMEILGFDFDGPNGTTNVFGTSTPANRTLGASLEAQFAGGDSGGPIFVRDNGVWKITGIATFNGKTDLSGGSTVNFGSIGGGTIVASYASWIQAQMVASPVPEPETYTLLLGGLGLVALVTRRSKGD